MNSFRLQSNPTAAFAYSQLNKTQALLNKNIQRLSSGLRINSAADDTAGSAMATRMTNQIRGMHQANRNSRDANNLLATTEAGLNNIGDLLAQMRELSVQAATDTLNDTDRASIDLEFQSLKNELTRIASVTEHNGMNLLNGTYQTDGSYDQVQPGTYDENGNADNLRGHWRIQIGADNDVDSQHEFSIMNATDVGLAINDDKVLTVDDARTAVTALDVAIDEVNRERSYIGSEQNKLQFTMSNLSSTINSIETARSNIEDVDYALEMSELSKNQILVQSSTAM
ncbi:MAG: flagellin, partial [Anaerolineales bacterium]|nr:flagellin [Anaerolineales bacterium]